MTLWVILVALKSGHLNLFKCIYDQSCKHVVKKDDPHLHRADTTNNVTKSTITSSSDSEAPCAR